MTNNRLVLIVDDQLDQLSDVLHTLADPTRLHIVCLLAIHEELTTKDIYSILQVPRSTIAYKMIKLASLHIIKSRRTGRLVYYSLTDPSAIPVELIVRLKC